MRRFAWVFLLGLTACASTPDVRRLSPVPGESHTPSECRLISIMPDSPAQKSGLAVEDRLLEINGKKPKDAWDANELVNASGDTMQASVGRSSDTARAVSIPLNKNRPRLGAACNLTGLRRLGVTAAGNESLTVFDGLYALTASGIVDKSLIFIRLRLSNNDTQDVVVSTRLFSVQDASGAPLAILSPKEVICDLFGDRGAKMLSLKARRLEAIDFESAALPPDVCGKMPVTGRLKGVDAAYVESNAEYLARESLWPQTLKPGQTADGVIYLAETKALPLTIRAQIQEKKLAVSLGNQNLEPSKQDMTYSQLVALLKDMKKNTPVRVTLKKQEKVFVGRFTSYDPIEEVVWFNASSGGLLSATSFPLRTIRAIQTVEQN